MTDSDPVESAMPEAQRLTADAVAPVVSAPEPAANPAREVSEPAPPQPIEVETDTAPKLASLPLDRAIRLRWSLRDIDRRRTRLSPVSPEDLKLLTELGLIDINGDVVALTTAGYLAID